MAIIVMSTMTGLTLMLDTLLLEHITLEPKQHQALTPPRSIVTIPTGLGAVGIIAVTMSPTLRSMVAGLLGVLKTLLVDIPVPKRVVVTTLLHNMAEQIVPDQRRRRTRMQRVPPTSPPFLSHRIPYPMAAQLPCSTPAVTGTTVILF